MTYAAYLDEVTKLAQEKGRQIQPAAIEDATIMKSIKEQVGYSQKGPFWTGSFYAGAASAGHGQNATAFSMSVIRHVSNTGISDNPYSYVNNSNNWTNKTTGGLAGTLAALTVNNMHGVTFGATTGYLSESAKLDFKAAGGTCLLGLAFEIIPA